MEKARGSGIQSLAEMIGAFAEVVQKSGKTSFKDFEAVTLYGPVRRAAAERCSGDKCRRAAKFVLRTWKDMVSSSGNVRVRMIPYPVAHHVSL